MRTTSLFAVGTCCGAIGAWIVLSGGSNPTSEGDRDRFAPATRASSASNAGIDQGESGRNDVPGAAGRQLALDAFELRADELPRDVFNEALALDDDGLRTSALLRVARVWARRDPEAALAAAGALPGDLQAVFGSAVAEEWAFVDPAGFFAYAEAAASINQIMDGLEALLATDPARVWAIAGRYAQGDVLAIDELYLRAVSAMTSRDPAGTIAQLRPVAVGQRRDPVLSSIAEAYANRDSDAALAWVMSLEPSSPEATSSVIKILAFDDMLHAYDVLRQVGGTTLSADNLAGLLAEAAVESRQDSAAIASALVQRAEPEVTDRLLSALLGRWVRKEPDGAMEWLSAHATNVTSEMTTSMVFNLAFEDVRLAASLADRVPPEFQYQWLDQVAFRYGQFDVAGAADWITQLEGRSDYGDILTRMLYGANLRDPQFVASYIETSGGAFTSDLVTDTANSWAQRDAQAAAQWAMRLGDPEQSDSALEGVAWAWVQSDPMAVQQWALEQPRGESRDRILDALMTSTGVSTTSLDYKSLAVAYTSEAAAQQTMSEYIEQAVQIPIPNPYREAAITQAERLLDLLTDPELRRQAEASMAAVR